MGSQFGKLIKQKIEAYLDVDVITLPCLTLPYLSLSLSAIAGFAGGFLVPVPEMPVYYSWLFHINPTHWAYGGMMRALISDVTFACELEGAPLECQSSTGW